MSEQSFPEPIPLWLNNNKTFAESYKQPPTMTQIRAQRFLPDREGTLIRVFDVSMMDNRDLTDSDATVTCLDPRCVPEAFFGPNLGAAVVRNAGGRPSKDVIRSILFIRSLAGIKNVIVLHHTDCGMTHLTEAEVFKEAKERTPDAAAEIDDFGHFGTFRAEDFEKTIKDDVLVLRQVKALAGMKIYGFALETETGIVRPLDA